MLLLFESSGDSLLRIKRFPILYPFHTSCYVPVCLQGSQGAVGKAGNPGEQVRLKINQFYEGILESNRMNKETF